MAGREIGRTRYEHIEVGVRDCGCGFVFNLDILDKSWSSVKFLLVSSYVTLHNGHILYYAFTMIAYSNSLHNFQFTKDSTR